MESRDLKGMCCWGKIRV